MGEVMYRCRKCLTQFPESDLEYDRVKLYTIVKQLNGREKFIDVYQDRGECPYCKASFEYIDEIKAGEG